MIFAGARMRTSGPVGAPAAHCGRFQDVHLISEPSRGRSGWLDGGGFPSISLSSTLDLEARLGKPDFKARRQPPGGTLDPLAQLQLDHGLVAAVPRDLPREHLAALVPDSGRSGAACRRGALEHAPAAPEAAVGKGLAGDRRECSRPGPPTPMPPGRPRGTPPGTRRAMPPAPGRAGTERYGPRRRTGSPAAGRAGRADRGGTRRRCRAAARPAARPPCRRTRCAPPRPPGRRSAPGCARAALDRPRRGSGPDQPPPAGVTRSRRARARRRPRSRGRRGAAGAATAQASGHRGSSA